MSPSLTLSRTGREPSTSTPRIVRMDRPSSLSSILRDRRIDIPSNRGEKSEIFEPCLIDDPFPINRNSLRIVSEIYYFDTTIVNSGTRRIVSTAPRRFCPSDRTSTEMTIPPTGQGGESGRRPLTRPLPSSLMVIWEYGNMDEMILKKSPSQTRQEPIFKNPFPQVGGFSSSGRGRNLLR